MRINEENIAILLTLACLVLTPFARAGEIPIILLALFGVKKIILERKEVFKSKAVVSFSALFLIFWLPMLLSSFDAVNMAKTNKEAWGFLRFYFCGYFLLRTVAHEEVIKRLLKYANYILLFWIVDALVQFVLGVDLFGFPVIPGRLNGIFGDNLKLGLFLGAYSPIVIAYILESDRKLIKYLTSLILILVMLLAGSRAGWIMFAIGSLTVFSHFCKDRQQIPWRNLFVGGILLTVVGVLSYQYIPSFSGRIDQSLLVLNGDYESIDNAVSIRLPIWETGWNMFESNLINGVGVRGFRYAYNSYAEDGNFWKNYSKDGTGAMHGHAMLIDIAAETGIIGLCGLVVFYVFLIWLWLKSQVQEKRLAYPFAAALAAALFPINTHFAFYSGAWLQVIFWLSILYIAALHRSTNTKSLAD